MIGLPQSVEELNQVMKSIHRMDKDEKRAGLMDLTALWEENIPLLHDFFSSSPYTFYQPELASYLYFKHGTDVYRFVKGLFPEDSGNVIDSWDAFMEAQIKYIVDIAWHQVDYENNHEKTIVQFSQDLEDVCDDYLYITMMVKLSRYTGVDCFDPADYVIDEAFFRQKVENLPRNQNGMREYAIFLGALAGYDIVAAMKAWGDFYYYFEEVYENNPSKRFSFSGALYNAVYHATLHSPDIILQVRNMPGHDAFNATHHLAEEKVRGYIHQYGWKYLHHAFEINALDETDLIYNALSSTDKEKADKATRAVKERISQKKKDVASSGSDGFADIDALKEVLEKDTLSGVKTWIAILKSLESGTKITKKTRKKYLDDVLFDVINKQIFDGPMKYVNLPGITFFHYAVPELTMEILKDDWLTKYLFSNCQLTAMPVEIMQYVLLMRDGKRFNSLISMLQSNKNIRDVEKVKDTVFQYATRGLDSLLEKSRRILESVAHDPYIPRDETTVNLFRYCRVKESEKYLSIPDHPEIVQELEKALKKYRRIAGGSV